MDFFTRYNPPSDEGVTPVGESLTQQEYKADCDVNNMIRRAIAGDTSVLRHPNYCNVLGAPSDSQELANRIANANTIWHDMPDKVKATFGSPEALLKHLDECAAKDAADMAAAAKAQEARERVANDNARKVAASQAAKTPVAEAQASEPSTGEAHA